MTLRFAKMHAHGDDFVIVDRRGKIGQPDATSPKRREPAEQLAPCVIATFYLAVGVRRVVHTFYKRSPPTLRI